jgi:hypothetical protein
MDMESPCKKREPLEATLGMKLGNHNHVKLMLSYPASVSEDCKHIAANFMQMINYVKRDGSFKSGALSGLASKYEIASSVLALLQ